MGTTGTGLQIYNEGTARAQMDVIQIVWKITAATTVGYYDAKPSILTGFATGGELAQTSIDALIPNSGIVAATSFGSTALGVDAFGFVLSLDGQLSKLFFADLSVTLAVPTLTVAVARADGAAYSTTNLPNTLAAPMRITRTTTGDVAGQFVITGLDAATAGTIVLNIYGKLK